MFKKTKRWRLTTSADVCADVLDTDCFYFWRLCSSQPEYKAADPICTFLFSALVLGTTFPVTKDVFRILMEGKKALPACSLGLSRVTDTKCSLCRSSSGRLCRQREKAAAVCQRSHGRSQFARLEPQHDAVAAVRPRDCRWADVYNSIHPRQREPVFELK